MIVLVLADDHVVFTEALTTVLREQSFRIGATARSLAEVVPLVREHQPDVCLLERRFNDGDGLDAVSPLIAVSPRTKVLIVTSDADPQDLDVAIRLGVSGYLHKTMGVGALIDGIERVLRGQIVIQTAPATPRPHARRRAANLTARERECLMLFVEGLGTAAIARRLGVSATTVRSHAQAVLMKLGVHSRLEAVAFALSHGLLAGSSLPIWELRDDLDDTPRLG